MNKNKYYNVLDIACFIINKHNELYPEKGITNLRLQKLLYFIQCYFYFYYYEPCFRENMEAWDFGPASREVYEEFCVYGGGNIPNVESYRFIDKETFEVKKVEFNARNINGIDAGLIQNIIEKCSDISDYKLVEITRSQTPWIYNYIKGEKNKIPNNDIKFFIDINVKGH